LDFDLVFEWDDANLDHIARHQVAPEEAEQIVENDPLDIEAESVDGEERTTSVGCTDRGRVLVVVTTLRGPRLRVVTAFRLPER
jgi:uncharacterized DUF497 family protein